MCIKILYSCPPAHLWLQLQPTWAERYCSDSTYSPTLNWDVWSSGSVCSFTSIMCRIPKELWIPKIDPLHQVAAKTTSQPAKPPSGGTKPAPWPGFSTCTLASKSEPGVRGGLQPVSISCVLLSSFTILPSLPSAWSCFLVSRSWGASLCSIWGPGAGCSVRDSLSDGCAWLSSPLVPMLSDLAERLLWAFGAHAWDIGRWHKSTDLNNSFDWLSVKRERRMVFFLAHKLPTRCSQPQLQRINSNLQT